MLRQIIEWFQSLWRDYEDPPYDYTWNDSESEYLRQRYGISKPYVDEEDDAN